MKESDKRIYLKYRTSCMEQRCSFFEPVDWENWLDQKDLICINLWDELGII